MYSHLTSSLGNGTLLSSRSIDFQILKEVFPDKSSLKDDPIHHYQPHCENSGWQVQKIQIRLVEAGRDINPRLKCCLSQMCHPSRWMKRWPPAARGNLLPDFSPWGNKLSFLLVASTKRPSSGSRWIVRSSTKLTTLVKGSTMNSGMLNAGEVGKWERIFFPPVSMRD